MKPNSTAAVSFSRVLGLPDAAALGWCISVGLIYVVGHPVLEFSGREAPLIYIVGAIIFLPIILSYAERAAYAPRSGSPYEMARSSGSVPAVFATGWLILGGYICVGGLLTYAVVKRLSVGLKLFFNVKPEAYWLVIAVIGLSYINSVIAFRGGWRRRTILVWAAFLTVVGLLAWSYFNPPPAGTQEVIEREDFRHWLSEMALLAAGLWFIDLILQQREQLKRPNRIVLRALLIVWMTSCLVGSVTTFIVFRYPSIMVTAWMDQLSVGQDRLEMLILLSGIVLCWIGLSRILASSVKLIDAMILDGFLPQWLEHVRAKLRGPFLPLTLFSGAIALVAIKGPVLLVVGAAALTFLWTTVMVMTPYARRSRKDLPTTRKPKLPAHPLFPSLAVGTALFFSFISPRSSLLAALGWLILGTVYFIAYARRGSVAAQRRDFMAGAEEEELPEDVYRVLVNIAEDSTAPSLIKAGAGLTRAQDGELLILRVIHLDENVPRYEIRDMAEWERLRLQRLVQGAGELGVSVQLLTRVAPSTAVGILSTAREQDAGFILLDWPDRSAERDEEAFAERVFEETFRPVGILRGTLPESVTKVLVADAGGPNVSAALEAGQALSGPDDGHVEFLRVVRPSSPATSTSQPEDDTHEEAGLPPGVEERVIEAAKKQETIMAESEGFDILVIGASVDPLLNQAVLSGLPAEIAEARSRLTMVVKRAEGQRQFWMHRVWGMVSNLLPTLNIRQRAEVFVQMRHSARATVDFYAMMCLASAIAMFGLALNSGAVIIGAMLVAPLMSPMVAIAHGIVRGSLVMIRQGVDSTVKGICVAIAVGTSITLIVPDFQPTAEILARTEPSVIDLLVALVSGAAGAYALSRTSVSAALPGVAIAAALVPPLCTVGYGLASSDFTIAGGALLLFVTNLSAIVLASVIIFLLVGFRPMRAGRGRVVTNSILVAILLIITLCIPLGFKTRTAVKTGKLELKLEELIHEAEEKDKFRAENLTIEKHEGAYVISATIYVYKDLPQGYLNKTGQSLAQEVGAPVEIRATVVRATLDETRREPKKEESSP